MGHCGVVFHNTGGFGDAGGFGDTFGDTKKEKKKKKGTRGLKSDPHPEQEAPRV